MIPRLGDGNAVAVTPLAPLSPRLENDSPSRGRKHWRFAEYDLVPAGLENDSPSRGRKHR